MDKDEKTIARRDFLKYGVATAALGAVSVSGLSPQAAGDQSPESAKTPDVYQDLAKHMSCLGMGFLQTEGFIDFLKGTLTPEEATVALGIPFVTIPLQAFSVEEIAGNAGLGKEKAGAVLAGLADKNLIFSAPTKDGQTGYAFYQFGFGMPQAPFWKGEDTPHARKMVKLIHNYLYPQVITETLGFETKPWRYVPVGRAVDVSRQAVYSYDAMEQIIQKSEDFALCHCSCRMEMRLLKGIVCEHPLETCMKFNNQARFVVSRGVGKKLTREQALEVLKKTEDAGLVHFVDNAQGDIQHNCNCCGCVCWNVGTIRRRLLPRDSFMATYYMRHTNTQTCTACGACAQICPVQALKIADNAVVVDEQWCIGCGVCATVCPTQSVKLRTRTDKDGIKPVATFTELHETILNAKARQVLKETGWGKV